MEGQLLTVSGVSAEDIRNSVNNNLGVARELKRTNKVRAQLHIYLCISTSLFPFSVIDSSVYGNEIKRANKAHTSFF